jgi:hypothetical protein
MGGAFFILFIEVGYLLSRFIASGVNNPEIFID